MILSLAIYPVKNLKTVQSKWEKYIILGKKYGFNEVFSTLHLPEFTLQEQLDSLTVLHKLVKKHHFELTVDIGGNYIEEILTHENYLKQLKNSEPDWIRLDYGYAKDSIRKLNQKIHPKGIVLNASIYSQEQIHEEVTFLKSLKPHVQIRACHNYYPRPESGLDEDFAITKQREFESYNIPVYYCIPDYHKPRGPMYDGLPTVETHRFLSADAVLMDLIHSYQCKAIMIADEFMEEKTFQAIRNVLEKKDIIIPVKFYPGCTSQEKKIVLQKHSFRYDSNCSFCRSESSREMASFASKVKPHNCCRRKTGDITIDNRKYLRYSGELQVVMKPAKEDSRVNVIAHTNNSGYYKLRYFRYGYTFRFVEE